MGASNGQGSYARIVQNGSERFIFVPQTIRSGQSNKIKINKGLPIENVASTAFHERLHTLGYGDVGSNPFNKAIAEKMLISPKSAPRELQLGLNYLGDSNEIAAWLAQSGKELNLKPGAKYIGREQLENLIETSPRLKQLRPYLNLNSDADFKRL